MRQLPLVQDGETTGKIFEIFSNFFYFIQIFFIVDRYCFDNRILLYFQSFNFFLISLVPSSTRV